MTFVGIDYSLTSPCVCIGRDKVFDHCFFHYLTDNKKHVGKVHNILGDEHDEYLYDSQRYENIASWVLGALPPPSDDVHILIEDYSYGSKGKVFHIAENCGLLKYLLWKEGYKYTTVAPTVVKKYATGKGNADKQKMYEAFYENTQLDLISVFSKTGRLTSPVTDIVDAYYLTCYLHDSIIEKKEPTNGKESPTKPRKPRRAGKQRL